MAETAPFSWDDLARFKKGGFIEGYPNFVRRFFAPDDKVHEVLKTIVRSARLSIACAMYGWDDDELDQLFRDAWNKQNLPVMLCLDKSQAGGVHEKELLAKWPQDQIGNSLVIGTSRFHAINHLKLLVVDGLLTVGGSTNWSTSGQTKQNNELTVVKDAIFGAETRAKIDMVYSEMLAQMLHAGQARTLAGAKPGGEPNAAGGFVSRA